MAVDGTTVRVLRAVLASTLGTLGLLVGGVAVVPTPAQACSCVREGFAEQVARADSVGVGAVAWVSDGPEHTTFAVDFEAVYKGELGTREKVLTASNEASCGLELETAEESSRRYLFLLQGVHRGRITASLCGGTTVTSPALEQRVERLTGPPAEPVSVDATRIEEPRGTRWWTWVGVGGLLLAGAGVWWRLRRAG